MKRKRFSVEQIVAVLKQAEAGTPVAELIRHPSPKRRVVDHLKAAYQVSERRACTLVRQARSVYRYRSRRNPRTEVRARMREIAAARVRYGYRKIRVMLQREGFELSKKVVCRLYREEGLSLRYRPSRRRRMQATRPMRSQARGTQRDLEPGFRGRSAESRGAFSGATSGGCLYP